MIDPATVIETGNQTSNPPEVALESNSSSAEQPQFDEPPSWIQAAIAIPAVYSALHNKPVIFSLYICHAAEALTFNQEYRNKPYATNVLSFPAELPDFIQSATDGFTLGDLICCSDVIEQEARAQNKPSKHHYAHMIIHGFLHLLGFDHINDTDAQLMESIEIQALKNLKIPSPYEAVV